MVAGAAVNLDRDVRQACAGKQLLVDGRLFGLVRDDRELGRKQARADRPYMQVDDARVAKSLDRPANGVLHRGRCLPIEQRMAAVAQEPVGPAADENGTDDSHGRVHPDRPQVLSGKQRHDREQRCQGIGEDMEVGAAQVVVLVTVAVPTTMPMPMPMPMTVPVPVMVGVRLGTVTVGVGLLLRCLAPDIEDEHRYPVHDQADDGDGNRRVERDWYRSSGRGWRERLRVAA